MSQGSNPEDWQAIRAAYEAGKSAKDCRAAFGITKAAWYEAVAHGEIILRRDRIAKPHRQTREAVAALLADGMTQAEIAAALHVARPTVCFHMRKLGIPARTEFTRRYDWQEIRAYYEAGNSATACRERFGFSRGVWVAAIRRGDIEVRPRSAPIESVLAAGRHRNRQHVKRRLTIAGLKPGCCENCGLSEWRGQPLSLQLHHVNGDGCDNRLENLRLLCPNCHSQTDTWGGRNKARNPAASAQHPIGGWRSGRSTSFGT